MPLNIIIINVDKQLPSSLMSKDRVPSRPVSRILRDRQRNQSLDRQQTYSLMLNSRITWKTLSRCIADHKHDRSFLQKAFKHHHRSSLQPLFGHHYELFLIITAKFQERHWTSAWSLVCIGKKRLSTAFLRIKHPSGSFSRLLIEKQRKH